MQNMEKFFFCFFIFRQNIFSERFCFLINSMEKKRNSTFCKYLLQNTFPIMLFVVSFYKSKNCWTKKNKNVNNKRLKLQIYIKIQEEGKMRERREHVKVYCRQSARIHPKKIKKQKEKTKGPFLCIIHISVHRSLCSSY